MLKYYNCLAGVASGATRAALTQHFALQNNSADISAKVYIIMITIDTLTIRARACARWKTYEKFTNTNFQLCTLLYSLTYVYWQEGSQETVATMAGMAIGMLIAHITMGQPIAIWFSFLSLTMFHMYGQYFSLLLYFSWKYFYMHRLCT